MGESSLPRHHRITRTDDYQRVYRTGRRVGSRHFLVFWTTADGPHSRVGISAGRKVGGAVMRNRVKRRLREILRRLRPRFARPLEVVVVAHPGAALLTTADMERELGRMMASSRLLIEP
jgi:ribonuclease P protein component